MSICGSHLDDLEQVLTLIDSGLQYVSHVPAYSITITITTIVTTTVYCYFYQCQLVYMFFCLCEIGPHTLQLILVKCINWPHAIQLCSLPVLNYSLLIMSGIIC